MIILFNNNVNLSKKAILKVYLKENLILKSSKVNYSYYIDNLIEKTIK